MTNGIDPRKYIVRGVKVIQVIEVISLRGKGTEDEIYREVIQYWSLDGVLLAEHDPVKVNEVKL